MKHIIIGTAGHIDHGKTCLTEALTGKDTDRLKEEKERGITIENGFAQMVFPDGLKAGVIDVPGHEKFVRNMIVGATGIDLALLVIAADDGFMPQTAEHLDILNLLGVKKGLIALTKSDLADEEWREVVTEDIAERVKGTFLEGAPVIPVSAKTGDGIEELKAAIREAVEETDSKNDRLPFRLPIDRVFTMQGFGTVVTGTLTEGILRAGDEAYVYPAEVPVRIRELQNHDEHADEMSAGMRTALNLTGYERSELKRGDTIAAPGSMTVTKRLDVSFTVTNDSPFNIKNASRLHLFHGTSEKICKIRLLDDDEYEPGRKGYAQLILEEPIAARNGDRFILRFFSPVLTIGGGTILDVSAGHRKRNNPDVLKRLENLSDDSLKVRICQYIEDRGVKLSNVKDISLIADTTEEQTSAAVSELAADGEIVIMSDMYMGAGAYKKIKERIVTILSDYHKEYPLRSGMSAASLRKEAFGDKKDAESHVFEKMTEEGILKIDKDKASLSGFEIKLDDKLKTAADSLKAAYVSSGSGSLTSEEAAEKSGLPSDKALMLEEYLVSKGDIVRLTPADSVSKEGYEKALAKFRELGAGGKPVALGDFRTAMEFSRKYAQMYLEHWDKAGISRREGDAHVLVR